MLVAIGPGIVNLQDYSPYVDYTQTSIVQSQGDTLDTFTLAIHDALAAFTIVDEDDIVALERDDPTGWPTVNLLINPSFEGTYVSGVAPSWTGGNTGATGVTASSSATSQYGAAAQSVSLLNAANATSVVISQSVSLPIDENQAPLVTLPYYLSAYVCVTGALANITARLAIDWYNAAGSFISSSTGASIPAGVAGYTRYSVSATPPASAAHAVCYLQLLTTSATNSGTVLLDGMQFERATFATASIYVGGGVYQSALAAGKYPTTYCDATQPGCYVDRGLSELAFRQLRLFGGFIRTAKYDYSVYGGVEADIAIQAVDYGVMLAESPATFVMPFQTDLECIAQAFTYGQQQGHLVGIDFTTFVMHIGSAGGFVFSWQTTRDAINKVANALVASYYVDYYKYFHFAPSLAVSAPYAVSYQPNGTSTFPFHDFSFTKDSTNSITTPVIEGSTQLSAPQQAAQTNGNTTSLSGTTATLSGAIAIGVTAIPVTSGGTGFAVGSSIQVGTNTANAETLVVASGSTATSIHITTATTKTHASADKVGAVVIANGASLTSLSVAATSGGLMKAGTILQIANGVTTVNAILTSDAANGATTLAISQGLETAGAAVSAPADFGAGCTVAVAGYQVNSGNPIVQVDSASVGGTALVIGLLNTNTFAQGFTALLDPSTAKLFFQNTAANAAALLCTFRYNTPVLVRLHASPAEAFTGTIRRRIHQHQKIDEIVSQQAAVDRGNAELNQRTKAQPIGELMVDSPPAPAATPLRVGQAISVTYPISGFTTGTLFQIQQVTITPILSNGGVVGLRYDCLIGFYRADFAIRFAQVMRDLAWQQTATTPNQVLQDVLAAAEGWAMTDSASASVSNVGVWAPPNTSTWSGSFVWG